ncbi:hypothetical protein EJB05_39563, partial [Eragrostis curvula]
MRRLRKILHFPLYRRVGDGADALCSRLGAGRKLHLLRRTPRAAKAGVVSLLPAENKNSKKNTEEDLTSMQAEMGRMNEENQRLRGMLTQGTSSYQSLQMHLFALMQQQQQHEAAVPPARQFLDQLPVASEPSNSSTEVGGSPRRQLQEERGESPEETLPPRAGEGRRAARRGLARATRRVDGARRDGGGGVQEEEGEERKKRKKKRKKKENEKNSGIHG